MDFRRIRPLPELERIIECYWIAEEADPTVRREKIIPDGFTEIIFHFGDPYRICIDGGWALQTRSLVAGQISEHFFLENTGRSSVLGIKLKPTALAQWYGLLMNEFTDKVVDCHSIPGTPFREMETRVRGVDDWRLRINQLNDYFRELSGTSAIPESAIERTVKNLLDGNGKLSLTDVQNFAGVGERQLEILFKRNVGLSPKLFARILRFNYIFQRVEEEKSWSDVAYEAAYYDQSHFIRNFRDFTGESPGKYAFDEKNLANFFLKKK